jgi:hypothetical protein
MQTKEFLGMAVEAIAGWDRIAHSAESNIFVVSLLLWKKWEIVRA